MRKRSIEGLRGRSSKQRGTMESSWGEGSGERAGVRYCWVEGSSQGGKVQRRVWGIKVGNVGLVNDDEMCSFYSRCDRSPGKV